MFIFTFLGIIFLIGTVLFLIIDNEKRKQVTQKNDINNLLSKNNFPQNKLFLPISTYDSGIVIDDNNERIAIISRKNLTLSIYEKPTILSVSVEHHYQVEQTITSKKSVNVGRAVAGGLLFGGVGAVVGGLSGKSSSKIVSNNNYLNSTITIYTTNIYLPEISLVFDTKTISEMIVDNINLMINRAE